MDLDQKNFINKTKLNISVLSRSVVAVFLWKNELKSELYYIIILFNKPYYHSLYVTW